ncbi:hypothetical protein [Aeromonas salmonicida]|uniref:Uncharacterized protein n=1 Tax=Aeromonas salmonicida TaxID=645 RepID=A0AAX1PKF2_AERSA|nr:hypothetical protein [Aeromonas salmonicida]RAJ06356.1 hypothetical protein DEU50_104137 [Aeromonas salmonicida]
MVNNYTYYKDLLQDDSSSKELRVFYESLLAGEHNELMKLLVDTFQINAIDDPSVIPLLNHSYFTEVELQTEETIAEIERANKINSKITYVMELQDGELLGFFHSDDMRPFSESEIVILNSEGNYSMLPTYSMFEALVMNAVDDSVDIIEKINNALCPYGIKIPSRAEYKEKYLKLSGCENRLADTDVPFFCDFSKVTSIGMSFTENQLYKNGFDFESKYISDNELYIENSNRGFFIRAMCSDNTFILDQIVLFADGKDGFNHYSEHLEDNLSWAMNRKEIEMIWGDPDRVVESRVIAGKKLHENIRYIKGGIQYCFAFSDDGLLSSISYMSEK